MATLHVRNVPDDVYERLRTRAARSGRSLSAEVIEIIETGLKRDPEAIKELFEQIRRQRESLPPRPPDAPTAEELLREDRAR